jgi:hypothetical protein
MQKIDLRPERSHYSDWRGQCLPYHRGTESANDNRFSPDSERH